MLNSREQLAQAKRIVVKVGSNLLTGGGKALDPVFFAKLAGELHGLRKAGYQVALVTSGAVAAGVHALGIAKPREIPRKQAAAAVGQSKLMHAYEEVFGALGVRVAQVLITGDDLGHRHRFLNARNTVTALFELDVVPIFNENDTVVVEEIKVGDNDNLSALVASMIEADLLVILSDVAGLYDADPRHDPQAKRFSVVPEITDEIEKFAGDAGSLQGTGGMITKLQAARKAGASGIPTLIAAGLEADVLKRLLSGEDLGTFIQSPTDKLASRKHWIAFVLKPVGKLMLDGGAVKAVREGGKSLLPGGVVNVEGKFGRGDAVSLCDAEGHEFARGLIEYAADEVRRMRGHKSTEIEQVLGYKYGDELVHRDDLVLLERRR
jgi:glutamate 5-kinase